MQEPSKDNSGDKIFVKKKDLEIWQKKPPLPDTASSELRIAEPVNHYQATLRDPNDYLLDESGRLVVKHDLFSHPLKEGLRTPDGIAEAFIEFAKKERLSFFV